MEILVNASKRYIHLEICGIGIVKYWGWNLMTTDLMEKPEKSVVAMGWNGSKALLLEGVPSRSKNTTLSFNWESSIGVPVALGLKVCENNDHTV
jgi:hypothetical protein